MFSRPTVFGIGFSLITLAAAGWLMAAAFLCEAKLIPRGSSHGTAREVGADSSGLQTVSADAPALATIQKLLSRQRRFGPAERGSEDEIRGALAGLLTDDNAGAVVRGLSGDELRTEFGALALSRWAATDAMSASLWLAQQPDRSDEQTWVIAHALAGDAVALDVLGDLLPAGSWREDLLEATSRASLSVDPDHAVLLAHRLQSEARMTRVLAAIADEQTLIDPKAVARWVMAEPDISRRDELLLSSATALASIDPAGALDCANGIASDAAYVRALDKIVSMWTDATTEPRHRISVLAALGDDRIAHPQN